jgi:hypothetical protein
VKASVGVKLYMRIQVPVLLMQFFLHYVLEFAASMAEVQLSCAIKDIVDIHQFVICDIAIVIYRVCLALHYSWHVVHYS